MVARMPTLLTLTADTPRELLTDALSAVLGDRVSAAADAADVVAVPVRGQGRDLTALLLDLAADLEAQRAEWGSGLDQVAIDGVLRTETGAYTAWGYLTGRADARPGGGATLRDVSVTAGSPLTLTATLVPPAATPLT